jgi:hypothetical protein
MIQRRRIPATPILEDLSRHYSERDTHDGHGNRMISFVQIVDFIRINGHLVNVCSSEDDGIIFIARHGLTPDNFRGLVLDEVRNAFPRALFIQLCFAQIEDGRWVCPLCLCGKYKTLLGCAQHLRTKHRLEPSNVLANHVIGDPVK